MKITFIFRQVHVIVEEGIEKKTRSPTVVPPPARVRLP